MCAYLLFGTLLLGRAGTGLADGDVYCVAGAGFVFAVVFAVVFRNSPREHPLVNEAEARVDTRSRRPHARRTAPPLLP